MLPDHRFLRIALVIPMLLTAKGHEDPQTSQLDGGRLATIRDAARELGREVEYLQDDIVAKQSGQPAVSGRVVTADEELHYLIWEHTTRDARRSQLLQRQTLAFVAVARQLVKSANYALGANTGRGGLVADLRQLEKANEQFQSSLAGGAAREKVQKDFSAVNLAWERAIRGLEDLNPREAVYLLRAAGRVDRLHERLFRLMHLEGKRPQLIIRT